MDPKTIKHYKVKDTGETSLTVYEVHPESICGAPYTRWLPS